MRRLVLILIAVALPHVVFAQASSSVRLLVGRSTIVDNGSAIARVSLTSADIADALVTAPDQLLINGKVPGTISMFVWDRAGAVRRYEIVVQRDLARLNEQMRQLFPGETIDAQSNGKDVVVSGIVSSKDVAEKAVSVAAGYVENKDQVVTLLHVRETAASNQVLLQVRFAEVSRSAMTELGASLFTSPLGVNNTVGRVTTQQFPSIGYDSLDYTKASSSVGSDPTGKSGTFTFSDFLNLFLFNYKYDVGTMIRALQTKGLFQSLAEPNLVAESGKEASFLAGGEIPIPVAQGSGVNMAISVQYKEFGVRLNFTPVVTGSRVQLKVRPEVSTLDFANAVTLNGFRIPALSTRRTETELELEDGQTFAIAGLMNNTMNSSLQKIPGIGDIPIIGQLFKSKAAQKNQTELVVMITPHILVRNSPGVTTKLPQLVEPYLPPVPPKKGLEIPPPAFPPPAAGEAPSGSAANPSGSPNAAEAAAAMSAMMPSRHLVVSGDPPPAGTPAASSSTTRDEQKALEQAATKEESRQQADQALNVDEAKRTAKEAAKQAKAERRAQQIERERQVKVAREQAKLTREQAKRDAKAAKAAAKQAKRQAEIAQKQEKAREKAEAQARAAEAARQAELARKQGKS